MEGNKDEAFRCREIGRAAWENGDFAKAVRLLEKAQRMCPSPETAALLEKATSRTPAPRPSTSPDGVKFRKVNSSNKQAPSKDEEPAARTYSVEQENICRQVLIAKDYYQMLGLKQDANDDAIKKAYRKLALQLHPDKNSAPKAEEAFKKISKAFQTLSDAAKRKRYDHTGQEDDQPHVASQHDSEFMTAEELFQAFFGFGGATIYTGPDGRTFVQRRRPHQRQNMPPATEAQRRVYNILQLLPVFIIVLLSIMGSDFFADHRADYRLIKTRDTPLLSETTRFQVPFFASPSFATKYPKGSLARDRSEAEIEFGFFWSECRRAHESLRRDIEYYQAIGHRDKTNELTTELRLKEGEHQDCKRMRELQREYPSEANRVRSGHSTVFTQRGW
eukprot:Gregarina_sp_Poly_1__10164@NODE_699_length_6701_cov_39_270274_g527_i0_p3_GENE_NODE_699_length_6701_cov_39_270274_g527_i0NODE_699_length_6701_cov_39_270274_g527_i0_p3_ORF_typecomplete_len390_score50_62DnaJ/PF00226_31/7_3e25DUF1977/PF09320_11/0_00015RPT/PF13446_6/0_0057TPR_16/PF13432_6/0_0084TPR_16/PF13432_6/1_1e03TPR_14/PF13428_6/0_023TPR_14/PF13428_6/1_1e03PMI_typeI/PF01238_21/0_008TPR_MalT/PF17874_1/0_062TPR_MalT/PF17874_1/2_9e03TPR_9/PF13371_6/0_095TPR_8/PF13181_6/0_14TPR_8/PF13181_6/6_3e03TPR